MWVAGCLSVPNKGGEKLGEIFTVGCVFKQVTCGDLQLGSIRESQQGKDDRDFKTNNYRLYN